MSGVARRNGVLHQARRGAPGLVPTPREPKRRRAPSDWEFWIGVACVALAVVCVLILHHPAAAVVLPQAYR